MKKAYTYLCLQTRIHPDLYGIYPIQTNRQYRNGGIGMPFFYHTHPTVSIVYGGIAWVMDSVVRLKSDRPHRILHIADSPEEIHMPEFDRTQGWVLCQTSGQAQTLSQASRLLFSDDRWLEQLCHVCVVHLRNRSNHSNPTCTQLRVSYKSRVRMGVRGFEVTRPPVCRPSAKVGHIWA